MLTRPFLLHALSSLHAGTGQAVDVIDLPIARQRSTGIPFLPGSSIKGVLRDTLDQDSTHPLDANQHLAIFGPPPEEAGAHAGALMVHDARLLALPVRSFRGVFAWVTSPLLLHLAARDLRGPLLGGSPLAIPQPREEEGLVANLAQAKNSVAVADEPVRIILEDIDLTLEQDGAVAGWAKLFAPYVYEEDASLFRDRFVVVADEVMAFLWETATQVDTRVRICGATGTVAKGALWTEESLPAETLLLGLLQADRSRRSDTPLEPETVLERVLPRREILQFGGKATVGRGRCDMIPLGDEP